MNNILTYEKYRDLVRLSESLNSDEYESLNINESENIVTRIKSKISGYHVDLVLKDEIELGKQVEERIRTTMNELSKVCSKLKVKGAQGSEFKKSLNKIIEDINKTSFNTLSLLGNASVDFGGFRRSAILANVVNLGALLSPIKNSLMLRRAYKYFIGMIQQTLRRDLVMLLVNFDQFQNMILQKSMESEESAKVSREVNQAYGKIEGMYQQALAEAVGNKSSKFMDKIKKAMDIKKQEVEIMDKHNPMAEFFMNSYDNTYKQTADTLKSLISEDSQKMLDAHKNSITKLGQGNEYLSVYGELLISSAEEKALKTTIAIHTNFLKISEVFKLSNQKKLVEMMQEAENQYQNDIEEMEKERSKKESEDFDKDVIDFINSEGKKLFSSVKTFDEFYDLHNKIKGPKDIEYSEKDILIRYILSNPKVVVSNDLKMVIPYSKYDADYNKCFLSYIDLIADKLSKAFIKDGDDRYLSLDDMKDDAGSTKIVNKFLKPDASGNFKIKDDAKKALKIIDSEVIHFDYELLLDKICESRNNSFGRVELNNKAFDELEKSIKDIKQYKDNDYSLSSNENKKSED